MQQLHFPTLSTLIIGIGLKATLALIHNYLNINSFLLPAGISADSRFVSIPQNYQK